MGNGEAAQPIEPEPIEEVAEPDYVEATNIAHMDQFEELTDPVVADQTEPPMDNPDFFETSTEPILHDDDLQEDVFQEDESVAQFDQLEESGEIYEPEQVVEIEEPINEPIALTPPQDEDGNTQDFAMPTEPDPTPVDVTEFANSEASNLDEGELVYDVVVSRLDSKDLRENFKYVLMDEKLKLNHHEYLKKIKHGKVVIPDLNPVKAKRIVEQLQFYDVDIRWVQKRVVMEELQQAEEMEAEEVEDAQA